MEETIKKISDTIKKFGFSNTVETIENEGRRPAARIILNESNSNGDRLSVYFKKTSRKGKPCWFAHAHKGDISNLENCISFSPMVDDDLKLNYHYLKDDSPEHAGSIMRRIMKWFINE